MLENLQEPPTVLMVDDEAGLLELFEAYLEAYCETRTTTNGENALELVDETVDVAILDRRMPGMTGDEILEEIRAAGYQFPVAMLTAIQADVDIIEMPFDAYLTKPVARDELVNVIEVLVGRRGYDEKSREFFRLAAKKRSLEANLDVDKGEDSEYEKLVERMDALREELNDTLETLIEEESAHTLE